MKIALYGYKGGDKLKAEELLEKLKKEVEQIYSFSKIGSFNNCEYEYYNTYVLRNRGIDNCYTLMGSCIHDSLESIYGGNGDKETLKANYNSKLAELDIIGVDFPNDKIKDSWVADMNHFVNNFNQIDSKMILEKLIVFELEKDIWVQGYVDAILPSDKGKPHVNVYDWKTSSKFSGKKLTEAGRQLVMYKVGLEQTTGMNVDKVMWFMVKYINVCSTLKNGKTKKKMCNRGKWVKEIRSQLEKELYKLGIDDFESELLLDKAVKENTLDCMPKDIQEKYWLEDCIVEYDVTEDKVSELKKYVVDIVNEINKRDKDNEDDWKPVEITKYNSFYCSTLCGHRKHCKYYKRFLDENANEFDKKKKEDLSDIFG